jgi:hypothetical protein
VTGLALTVSKCPPMNKALRIRHRLECLVLSDKKWSPLPPLANRRVSGNREGAVNNAPKERESAVHFPRRDAPNPQLEGAFREGAYLTTPGVHP